MSVLGRLELEGVRRKTSGEIRTRLVGNVALLEAIKVCAGRAISNSISEC